MKSFIAKVLRNLLAMILAWMIFMGVAIVFTVGLIGALGSKAMVAVPEKAVLVMDLEMIVPDSPRSPNPFAALSRGVGTPDEISLKALLDAIDAAVGDGRIQSLLIKGPSAGGSIQTSVANALEIRAALERFKESGKPLYAYLENTSQANYFLASVADQVFMHPHCTLELKGLALERVFLGNAFEKYGIGVQTATAGDYKSALDTFTRTSMSPQDKEQVEGLLDVAWALVSEGIAASRGLDPQHILALSSQAGLILPEEALQAGLVDGTYYIDEIIGMLSDEVGEDSHTNSFHQVGLVDYANSLMAPLAPNSGGKVALIYLEGEIVNGEGNWDQVGGARVSRELRKLRHDDEVKAVVMRINSPGGSVSASEMILREVELLSEEVPVVVSMGGVAASGGYWVTTKSDAVFASPLTVTGSIGVFAALFNVQELAGNWGVTFDGIETSPFAGIFSPTRPRDDVELQRLNFIVEAAYADFLHIVSEARQLPLEQIRPLAGGRVWAGADAVDVQLVDHTGGLLDAIAHAAELAGLDDYWIEEVSASREFADVLKELFGARIAVFDPTPAILQAEANKWKQAVGSYNDPRGLYARMPYTLRLNW